MNAEIITIGDEILIGQIVDTNSAWMAQHLNDIGINVRQITSISDQPNHILAALSEAGKTSPLVLVTGGLGPTKDDLTKETICDYFGTKLVRNQEVLKHIESLLKPRNIVINELNRDQALTPESALVLHNELGTAPGLWFEKDQTIYIFMPGVPFEMKYLMEKEVLPRLNALQSNLVIVHKTVLTIGLPESALAEKISEWEANLDPCIKLAYLPSPIAMKLRLTAKGKDKADLENTISDSISSLKGIIGENIFGYDEETMAENVGKLLMEAKAEVAVAESCTGGYLAHSFTSNPGSSRYFKGSITAYANEIKTDLLNVDPATIEQQGAVSREVVEQMARGIRKSMSVAYSISTSGIAGPEGGTEEKPVGTVWIAVGTPTRVVSKCYNFGNNRERHIIRTTQTALNLLRRILLEDLYDVRGKQNETK